MKEIKCRDLLASEIECRVGNTKKEKVFDQKLGKEIERVVGFSLLLYKTARADMTLLDETYGANNWQCEYYQVKNTMICAISIWDEEKQQWIKKCDGGDDNFTTEQVKGECSDAFKRAGFRVLPSTRKLYNSPFIWLQTKDGHSPFDRFEVKEIGYDETSVIKLVIVNEKTKQVVYSYGSTDKVSNNAPRNENKTIQQSEEPNRAKDITIIQAHEKFYEPSRFKDWLKRFSGQEDYNKLDDEHLHKVAQALERNAK